LPRDAGDADAALADGDHRDPDADRHREEERDPDGRLCPGGGANARRARARGDPRGRAGAFPSDHHDHPGVDGCGAAAGDRFRHRFGNAPAARHRDRRWPDGVAAADPAEHAGDLPVAARPPRAQGETQAAARGAPPPEAGDQADAGLAGVGAASAATGGEESRLKPLLRPPLRPFLRRSYGRSCTIPAIRQTRSARRARSRARFSVACYGSGFLPNGPKPMRLRPAALLASLTFCVATLSPPPVAAADALSIPAIQYRERTLPNGLQVLSVEDHASPNVAVQMWYHVGSRDDPQGRSGFAHLFEHLMFKSTKHMHAEQFDRLTEDVGGANNASTGDDITNYYEVVPSNHLQTLLWAEAERLSNLNVDEANFTSERAVVEEEYRQSVLAQPYGKLFNAIDQYSYKVHPYKRRTIGSIPDLEAASLKDVIAFHDTYYRPDNATLIVAGDFDPKQLDAWVDQYFGWI